MNSSHLAIDVFLRKKFLERYFFDEEKTFNCHLESKLALDM